MTSSYRDKTYKGHNTSNQTNNNSNHTIEFTKCAIQPFKLTLTKPFRKQQLTHSPSCYATTLAECELVVLKLKPFVSNRIRKKNFTLARLQKINAGPYN